MATVLGSSWKTELAEDKTTPRTGPGFWLVQALLLALTAGLLAWVIQQQSNTLHENGRWSSAKIGRSHGILGAVSFLTTRTALHRARLDLGTWHGYQELWTREDLPAEDLSLRFRFDEAGSFTVLLRRQDGTADGIRFSRNPGEVSQCLHVATTGQFLSRTPLEAPVGSGWHRLRWNQAGDRRQVHLDGRSLGDCGAVDSDRRALGLRSTGSKRILVDDIEMRGPNGQAFDEGFFNSRGLALVILGMALLVGLIDGFVLAATANARKRGEVSSAAMLLGVHGLLFLLAGVVFLAEWIYFGRLHPNEPEFADYVNEIEYEGQIVPRLAKQFPLRPAPDGVRRIVWLGSSQTWGSGAKRPENAWVALLAREWAKPGRVELINTGIPAFKAHQIRELWESDWVKWDPEVAVINLANNDRDREQFDRELRRMIRFNRERGIRSVLIQEPNSEEARSDKSLSGLRERHEVIRRVGEEEDVPVLNLHQSLLARRDEGFLWWDRVHFTDFGHEVMAEEVDRHRENILPEPSEVAPR